MRLLVTGGTGFIGRPMCRTLAEHGHELLVLTHRAVPPLPSTRMRFLSWESVDWQGALAEVEGVINLSGESIVGKRWSPGRKSLIRESRVGTTRRLVSAMAAHATRPSLLINASAIGFYGAHGDEELTEDHPSGQGFLADTCQGWEAEAQRASDLGVRVVRLRIGLVLGAGGGALAKMAPPFRAFFGGPLGSGRQWMSWIHRDDLIALIEWTLSHPELSGAVNATAPNPVRMRELCAELGRALQRPSWAPVPAFALRLFLGEMAEMLLTGQRVIPSVALRAGFIFRFPDLMPALEACLHR